MPYTLPKTLTAGQPENVNDLNENLAALLTAVNELSVATSAELPAGVVQFTADDAVPAGWLAANGDPVSRTDYARLFAAIGTTYGAGDGSTTFNLPDVDGRAIFGRTAGNAKFNGLGETGGAETVSLAESQIPIHSHPFGASGTHTIKLSTLMYDPGPGIGSGSENTVVPDSVGATLVDNIVTDSGSTEVTGGGGAHENLPPYIALNAIIKT